MKMVKQPTGGEYIGVLLIGQLVRRDIADRCELPLAARKSADMQDRRAGMLGIGAWPL
jgi:hypothetical protein